MFSAYFLLKKADGWCYLSAFDAGSLIAAPATQQVFGLSRARASLKLMQNYISYSSGCLL